MLSLGAATGAVVVLGDSRAIDADRLAVGSRPAGEHALCPAAGAGSVRAHGDREAGPADPASGQLARCLPAAREHLSQVNPQQCGAGHERHAES
jgi:hypothetical protein